MIYIKPKPNEQKFTCPHCNAIAHQTWATEITGDIISTIKPITSTRTKKTIIGKYKLNDLSSAKCSNCEKYSLWINGTMIYPNISNIELPNEDMPENVKKDYMEARSIVEDSPRGACALLRLALDKLMDEIGSKGDTLHQKILDYIEDKGGTGTSLEHALTSVRVIGNAAVHIGILDVDDDIETATSLFSILNFIVDDTITKNKKIEEIHNKLPMSRRLDKTS